MKSLKISKKWVCLAGVILAAGIFLAVDFAIEPAFFKNLVSIVRSAFDVDPAPQSGSNLYVCTDAVTWPDFCSGAALQPTLSWTVSSGTQSAYAVQVDNNGRGPTVPSSSFPTPEVDTGQVNSASHSYTVLPGALNWNTTYYWQIAVKDNFGSWSGWTESSTTFTTQPHAWPSVSFVCSPSKPGIDQVVVCLDTSTVYGGTTKTQWQWTMPADATYVNDTNANSQNPQVKFSSTGAKNITLQVWDSDSFNCSRTTAGAVDVRQTAEWKEIIPQ